MVEAATTFPDDVTKPAGNCPQPGDTRVVQLTKKTAADKVEAKLGCAHCSDKHGNGVAKTYCESSVDAADELFVKKKGDTVNGLATVKMNGNIPDIPVICSSGGGGALILRAVEALAVSKGAGAAVKLHSLSHVIEYYMKQGYEPKDCVCPCAVSPTMQTQVVAAESASFGFDPLIIKTQMITDGLVATTGCADVTACDKMGYTFTKCVP
jgi:hypothetical protein